MSSLYEKQIQGTIIYITYLQLNKHFLALEKNLCSICENEKLFLLFWKSGLRGLGNIKYNIKVILTLIIIIIIIIIIIQI